jgi:hypothetical protein
LKIFFVGNLTLHGWAVLTLTFASLQHHSQHPTTVSISEECWTIGLHIKAVFFISRKEACHCNMLQHR